MTQKEIAKILGISRATVSLALRNHPKIKKETREKVLKLARMLKYRPNVMAQNLITGKTLTIGIIQPYPLSPFFVELVGKIHFLLRKKNYVCISIESGLGKELNEVLDIFLTRRVDGLICLISFIDLEKIIHIKMENIPGVFYHEDPDLPVDLVAVDTYKGGTLATEHLINLGHKKIGFLGKGHNEQTDRRFLGYKHTLLKNGLGIDERLVIPGYGDFKTGYEGMKKILALKDRPTAIIAHNDVVAIGAMSAIHEAKLRIPQDIAIVGFDNIENSKYLSEPLTTIEFSREEIAKKLVEMLFFRLDKTNGIEYKKFIVEPKLVIRSSCGYFLRERNKSWGKSL
ncbi:MAG: LacI family transcriptional regulator [Candidatus Omnitrophica bacterium]|nr:LacI family transcriptional regulator [Candidatus Omnitrophota bacterium]